MGRGHSEQRLNICEVQCLWTSQMWTVGLAGTRCLQPWLGGQLIRCVWGACGRSGWRSPGWWWGGCRARVAGGGSLGRTWRGCRATADPEQGGNSETCTLEGGVLEKGGTARLLCESLGGWVESELLCGTGTLQAARGHKLPPRPF